MKSKNINKRLVINKETVSNLDSNELRKAYGGTRTFIAGGPPSCVSETNHHTCYTICGVTCPGLTICAGC